MKTKIKKVIATICVGTMALSLTPVTAMAETITVSDGQLTVSEISPRMQYIHDVTCTFGFTGTVASVIASVDGYVNQATKAKIIAELQVNTSGDNWIPVKIWTVTEDNYRAEVDETYAATAGNTYRVKVTATVWEGSLSETQTMYTSEKTA